MEHKRQVKSKSVGTPPPKREAETPIALLNDVVLQTIFKYLGYKDLKSCRNVKNSTWLRNSNKAWWSRTKVALHEIDLKKYLKQPGINSCAKNYNLHLLNMSSYHAIWVQFGHSIKYLELNSCELNSVDEFRDIFYTKFPNLEKLVANDLDINSSTKAVETMEWQEPQFGVQKNLKFLRLKFIGNKMPLSWMELLSHFPNLEAIETASKKVNIYKVISIIRQHDPKMLKLKHIDIDIEEREERDHDECVRLVLLDPNLSFETIRIRHRIFQGKTVVDILDLHAESLRELLVACFNLKDGRNELSPRQLLLNLEEFSLSICTLTLDIFKWTPNLRKVYLNYDVVPNWLSSGKSDLRIDTCKELTVNINGSPKLFIPVSLNVFPNVEILDISGLDNENFSMICERFTKLVSLTVSRDSQVDDFGLLGFDTDSKTETVRNPNITNLKDLQTFSMKSEAFPVKRNGSGWEEIGIKMKHGDVILTELEKLPQLKKFELEDYQLKEKKVWKKIFAKYPGAQ